jgi:hypothetical protein
LNPVSPKEKAEMAERLLDESYGGKLNERNMNIRTSESHYFLWRLLFGFGNEFSDNVRKILNDAAAKKIKQLQKSK